MERHLEPSIAFAALPGEVPLLLHNAEVEVKLLSDRPRYLLTTWLYLTGLGIYPPEHGHNVN
jgi:hypothetical protein